MGPQSCCKDLCYHAAICLTCGAQRLVDVTICVAIQLPYPLAPPHTKQLCNRAFQSTLLFGIVSKATRALDSADVHCNMRVSSAGGVQDGQF
jgi:hypothetical protein